MPIADAPAKDGTIAICTPRSSIVAYFGPAFSGTSCYPLPPRVPIVLSSAKASFQEVETNEELKLIDRGRDLDGSRADALHLSSRMRESFADSIVYGWEGLEGTSGLPDPDDEHVLAAAVVGGAGCIVTENMRDFPLDNIPEGLQIIGAVDFAHETVSMRPDLGAAAVTASAQRSDRRSTRQCRRRTSLTSYDRRYELNLHTAMVPSSSIPSWTRALRRGCSHQTPG